MFCVNKDCGCELEAQSRFCSVCGTAQAEIAATANIDLDDDKANEKDGIKVGSIYDGRVTRLLDFGAVVNLLPGRDGLLHVSQITDKPANRVADHLSEGQVVRVKVIETDDKGRVRLSMKAVSSSDRPLERESGSKKLPFAPLSPAGAKSASIDPAALDATATGQWLVQACQVVTGEILSTIVIPWNKTIELAETKFESVKEEAATRASRIEQDVKKEMSADLVKLDEIWRHFKGVALPPAQDAIGQELKLHKSNSRSVSMTDEDSPRVEEAYQAAKSFDAISESLGILVVNRLKSSGIWVFVAFWIAIGLGTGSGSLGFFFGAMVAVAIAFMMERARIGGATTLWGNLVSRMALKHYRLTHSVLHATQEANERIGAAEAELDATLSELVKRTEASTLSLKAAIAKIYKTGTYKTAPTSDRAIWASWAPVADHAGVIRIGELGINVKNLPTRYRHLAQGSQLISGFTLPILASLNNGKSIYVRINDHAQAQYGCRIAKSLIFRTLASDPPAKVLFTFIDPIGQGQNCASFLSLADYDESLVNSKAWTDARQIERKLTDLTEHMETVIQKYLRTDYATIDAYNKAAGEIAEPYRVVVVFDFPDSISENAARQLERIVQNGARCGVYAIVVHDTTKKASYGVNEGNIIKHSLAFNEQRGAFTWDNYGYGSHDNSVSLTLDDSPPEELVRLVVKAVGEASKDALKVEVPYAKLLQLAGIDRSRVWADSTTAGIRIPLGPGSARKPRFLELGTGLAVHALVVGRPGSGKSNLMHVVISTAALQYSPEDLHLYLIDFKEGVEFKPYAEVALPHARVIAIKSEREFGLSVLRALDSILKQRGELFRKAGVDNISQYRELTDEKGRKRTLPRILLVVDEFQEFFVKQDAISDEVAGLFDRVVRQGRAFGMHLLLGSQTLAGYSLPKATLNLITVRIALQSSEADSRMILADDNSAARLLSRPGEGIYNASSGLVEGNNLFQVALFEDQDRQEITSLVNARFHELRAMGSFPIDEFPTPLVFEGHEPAVLEKSAPISALLKAPNWPEGRRAFEVWLGEPIAIKPPTAMKVSKRGGSHLLVVTKNEEEAVGVLTAAMVSLVAQVSPGASDMSILDLTTADAAWADVPEHLEELFSTHKIKVLDRRGLQGVLERLSSIVRERAEEGRKVDTSHYLVLLGMHRARDLRHEGYSSGLRLDEVSKPDLAAQFATILRDGPECGVHIMAWCDSYANLDRTMDSRLIAEFGTRVVGQMSNSDSSRLIDDDAAAQIDRPHRLIKYDEDHVGVLEMFRPYAIPNRAWLENVGANLRKRVVEHEERIR